MSVKERGSNVSGPLRTLRTVNSQKVVGRSADVTVAALTANAAETYSITDADAKVGDVIAVSPQTAPEAGWGIEAAWCATAGTIVVRARNHSAGTLTGGSLTLSYSITR